MTFKTIKPIIEDLLKGVINVIALGKSFSFNQIKKIIIPVFKNTVVKILLAKLIGTTVGLKAWIVKFIVEHAFDLIAKPIIEQSLIKGALFYDQAKGKIIIMKMNKAKEDNDEDAYNDAVDDIFN